MSSYYIHSLIIILISVFATGLLLRLACVLDNVSRGKYANPSTNLQELAESNAIRLIMLMLIICTLCSAAFQCITLMESVIYIGKDDIAVSTINEKNASNELLNFLKENNNKYTDYDTVEQTTSIKDESNKEWLNRIVSLSFEVPLDREYSYINNTSVLSITGLLEPSYRDGKSAYTINNITLAPEDERELSTLASFTPYGTVTIEIAYNKSNENQSNITQNKITPDNTDKYTLTEFKVKDIKLVKQQSLVYSSEYPVRRLSNDIS